MKEDQLHQLPMMLLCPPPKMVCWEGDHCNIHAATTVAAGGGLIGPYSGEARRLYVGNLHLNMKEDQCRQLPMMLLCPPRKMVCWEGDRCNIHDITHPTPDLTCTEGQIYIDSQLDILTGKITKLDITVKFSC
ncbi:uncharacterized protein LOC130779938 [Actinidia eriantha]|uniref:uncharacterized protein LOC130779938 n=1 Tax=Actinidia eriantha TaxID=165200 RepID=UPI002583D926|nr:uncharacterized protein LOC130779938 [Actinidia eriantha]